MDSMVLCQEGFQEVARTTGGFVGHPEKFEKILDPSKLALVEIVFQSQTHVVYGSCWGWNERTGRQAQKDHRRTRKRAKIAKRLGGTKCQIAPGKEWPLLDPRIRKRRCRRPRRKVAENHCPKSRLRVTTTGKLALQRQPCFPFYLCFFVTRVLLSLFKSTFEFHFLFYLRAFTSCSL